MSLIDELPIGRTELSKDTRQIYSIHSDYHSAWVGESGVTRIVAYDESGHMANVPWLAVIKGDVLAERICADGFRVMYMDGEKF